MPCKLIALLLSVCFVSAGCQPDHESSGDSRADDSSLAVGSPSQMSDSISSVRDTQAMERNPETDPWLFEGIPNFEDLLAGRDGDWFIVLGSQKRSEPALAPTIMAADDPALADIQQRAWNSGRVPFVIASETLPAFKPGLTVIVLGPFAQAEAESQLAELDTLFPEAYMKAGW